MQKALSTTAWTKQLETTHANGPVHNLSYNYTTDLAIAWPQMAHRALISLFT